jgi:hypothetical protein
MPSSMCLALEKYANKSEAVYLLLCIIATVCTYNIALMGLDAVGDAQARDYVRSYQQYKSLLWLQRGITEPEGNVCLARGFSSQA